MGTTPSPRHQKSIAKTTPSEFNAALQSSKPNKTPDPVDTVLNIMDAASDAVKWVHSNWERSEQELNSHCDM